MHRQRQLNSLPVGRPELHLERIAFRLQHHTIKECAQTVGIHKPVEEDLDMVALAAAGADVNQVAGHAIPGQDLDQLLHLERIGIVNVEADELAAVRSKGKGGESPETGRMPVSGILPHKQRK